MPYKHKGFKKSMKLYSEAFKIIPYGVSSNTRLWHTICPTFAPCAIFIDRAKGSHLWDVDGNNYIDYRLAFGPIILGHSYKPVHDFVHKYDDRGLVYALDNELEIKVTKQILSMVPCAEMVRYANTGTEATMTAIRIARAFTGKEKIIKFEGHYHGHHDYVLFSTDIKLDRIPKNVETVPMSLGIPKSIKNLVITARWNDFEGIEKIVRKHANQVAAIICEPIMANAGVINPEKGFLDHLRKLCNEYGIVFIMDEVKTGFRLAPGGAQEVFKVKPDLATFAKSMSNGYPISCVTGRREVMEMLAPGKVVHGGTYTSNPVSLAATFATLKILKKPQVFKHIYSYGRILMKTVYEILTERDMPHVVQGYPSMFQFYFTKAGRAFKEYRDWKNVDMNMFANLQFELLKRGVMLDEDNGEPIYICYSHSKQDLRKTLGAFEEAIPNAMIPKSNLRKHFALHTGL